MAHKARKRFGQNFLIDQQVISEIIEYIHPLSEDRIVEIGPGLGALTKPLISKLNHLNVIELDRDIVAHLKSELPANKLTIYAADAMKFDFSKLGKNLRIVGNLPYNISTPLLFYLSDFSALIQDIHVMLQKEVVDRMVANPSTTDYGRLSVMLQYRFDMERLLTVSAESFRPMPKVQSAIVCMTPLHHRTQIVLDETLFSRIVAAAFSQRRKTLRNTLSAFLKQEDFQHLSIDSQLRAENLTVEQFIKVSNHITVRQNTIHR